MTTQALTLKGREFTIRRFADGDQAAVLQFARLLPEHDLLFLSRDITHPKVVAAWLAQISEGQIDSFLAFEGETVVGCTALVRDSFGWSPHVGEIRVLIATEVRGTGLGRVLAQETFNAALGHGLRKLTAQMTVDQTGAIGLFEEMGFRGEALLKDHVRGRDGRTHDIAVLSCDIARVADQRHALGLSEAAA